PNARFRVLELLKQNFGPGDKLVSTRTIGPDVTAQAYETSAGRKLLLINKENSKITVGLPDEVAGAQVEVVDVVSGENPAQTTTLSGTKITLSPFSVAVVIIPAHE
ncbi:MAG: glycosyl hydrolase family 39, partial [Verrucomicrobiota bacterium]